MTSSQLTISGIECEAHPKNITDGNEDMSLNRKDIIDLIGMCDRTVGYCGVSDPAGKRALKLKSKLESITL